MNAEEKLMVEARVEELVSLMAEMITEFNASTEQVIAGFRKSLAHFTMRQNGLRPSQTGDVKSAVEIAALKYVIAAFG